MKGGGYTGKVQAVKDFPLKRPGKTSSERIAVLRCCSAAVLQSYSEANFRMVEKIVLTCGRASFSETSLGSEGHERMIPKGAI